MNNQSPETKSEKPAPRRRSALKKTAVLAGLAAIVGAAAIYATGALDGNGGLITAALPGGQCKAAVALGESLKPLMTGDVAAMANRTQANDLSALSFRNGDGNAVTLADTGAKTRLVNLWATWCAPCREEMPALDALQAAKGGDDFEVVAISVDGGTDEKPRKFFDEIGVKSLSFYHDPTIGAFNTVKKEGLALGLPVTMLVDSNNCVVANMNGPAAWESDDARRLIDAAVAAGKAGS